MTYFQTTNDLLIQNTTGQKLINGEIAMKKSREKRHNEVFLFSENMTSPVTFCFLFWTTVLLADQTKIV